MARSPLDIHTLLVIRQAGRWLRKMRHGRRACPAGSGVRRVIGGPAVVTSPPSRFFGVSRAVPDRLRAIAESGLCRWDDASPRKMGVGGPGDRGCNPTSPRVPAKGATVGQLARLAVRLRALPLLRSRFSWLFLPISPGRSLRSPRRVPGDPVPVPVLSARRGRSSVLPVRPDGTGGSSRRRRPKGKPRLRGAVSARTGRLCRVNGSAGASLSSCGLCAALPISPGRSLRSPRRVPGNPVPVPVLSARRGRSSVLPVRPDGTGGSSRRRRPKGKPRLRGAVSARTGRLCRVNGSAGASLSCCGLCAALPISPGRSLRSPRRVPGDPVPVPVLSARRGRSSVLPVRPDGTGGSSRRRRPEGASPACGAQSRPARDGCAGSTALPVPLSLLRPLCRSADQSRAKPAKP